MNKCTYDSIDAVKALLEDACTQGRQVGRRLAAILADIVPSDYNKAVAYWNGYKVSDPNICATEMGTDVQVKKTESDGKKSWMMIDQLPAQLRWDTVSQIANQMKINTEDKRDL